MKRFVIFIATALTISSCGPASLYYWGGTRNNVTTYEHLAYVTYDKQTPQSICKLICAYEDMVSNPGGTRKLPPPGICAEYGYLLLQKETPELFVNYATPYQKQIFGADNYAVLFREKGLEMFQKELEYYPESAVFIKPLIDKFAR